MQVVWTARSLGWAVLFAALMGPPSHAQTVNVDRMAESIREAILNADASRNAAARISALEGAAYSLGVLERLRHSGEGEARERAGTIVAELRNEGLSPDLIAYWIVVAKVKELEGLQDPQALLAAELASTRLAEAIGSPVYRAGAMAAIGRALVKAKSEAGAHRAAERVLAIAAELSDRGERTAAANSAAVIAVQSGGLDDAIAAQGVSMMLRPRDRGHAWHNLARESLKGSDLAKADGRRLAAAARDALGRRDLKTAMQLAFAIPPDEGAARTRLLTSILEGAAEVPDYEVAQRVSLGFTDKDDQEEAVRSIVSRMIDGREPLRALTAIERLFVGSAKAEAFRELAVDLDKLGYTQPADDAFERAIAAASGLPDVTASIARALANSKRLDRATAIAATLGTREALSVANAAIAKTLSDMGRVADAEALLPTLIDAKDKSTALSGIARAKARGGDVAGALAVIPTLTNEEHKDRVLAAVVEAEARRGDFDASRKAALEVGDPKRRLDSFLKLYRRSARQNDTRVMRQFIGQAVEIAKNQKGSDRDDSLLEIAEAQADAGDIDGASAVAASISDARKRDKARAEITKALARKKRLSEAQSALQTIAANDVRDEVVAAVAPDLLAGGETLPSVYGRLTALKDETLRRAALRASAESAAERLDTLRRLQPSENTDGGSSPSPAASASTVGGVTFRDKGIELSELKGVPAAFRKLVLPSLKTTAADVRGMVPAIRDGRASIAVMTENGYFAKFFEDLPRGRFGAEATAVAQGLTAPRYLLIESGVLSLRELEARFPSAFKTVDGALTVRLPILVSPGATLVVSGLDARRIRLSVDAGVFIVNAGSLYVVDAEILGWDENGARVAWHDKDDSPNFRPFIISWSNSQTFVAGSKLVALGYQSPKAFGLSLSAGPSNVMKRHSDKGEPSGIIVDSLFENFEYGVYTYEAQNVVMLGNEYKDSVVYGMDPHDRSHGLTIAYNTAYGTHEKHGIIVSREVDRSFIIGNVVFKNRGSGFMLDRDSTANVMYANTAFDNDQDGITLFESSCNLIVANHLNANRRAGIKLRNSWDVGIHLNAIVKNTRSGIDGYIADLRSSSSQQGRDYELDPYVPVTTFVATGNDLVGNGSGISLAGVSGAALSENTVRLKPKRLYTGDVSMIMLKMLQMSSRAVVRSTCRPKRPAYLCPLRDGGLIGDDASADLFDPAGPDDCTDVEGSVQSSAFRRFREAS